MPDKEGWKVLVIADSDHANLEDDDGQDKTNSTQGKLILQARQGGWCFPITWGATKCRGVCRSPLFSRYISSIGWARGGFFQSSHRVHLLVEGGDNQVTGVD